MKPMPAAGGSGDRTVPSGCDDEPTFSVGKPEAPYVRRLVLGLEPGSWLLFRARGRGGATSVGAAVFGTKDGAARPLGALFRRGLRQLRSSERLQGTTPATWHGLR